MFNAEGADIGQESGLGTLLPLNRSSSHRSADHSLPGSVCSLSGRISDINILYPLIVPKSLMRTFTIIRTTGKRSSSKEGTLPSSNSQPIKESRTIYQKGPWIMFFTSQIPRSRIMLRLWKLSNGSGKN